ncbi:MlaE family ABC transporter permease, partial [Thermodesulfobacteriota bacterium]
MAARKNPTSLLFLAGRPPAFIGGGVITALNHLRYWLSVSFAVLWQALRPLNWRRSVRREFIRQCYFTGARALGFVIILALLVGIGMVFEVLFWLDIAGQSDYVGRLIVLLLVREIAPILVALVVIGRSGAAIVAELGNMRISGQVRML